MLLAEPPPSQFDLHFRLFGIPVRVHPFFWVVGVLLGAHSGEPAVNLLIWMGVLFVSILVHEFGHAVAAQLHGWPPRITLYGLGGLASYRPTYHDTRSQVLILLAGPGAGFVLAAMVMAVVHAAGHHVYVAQAEPLPYWVFYRPEFRSANLNVLVKYLLLANIYYGLVNLLPILPLDGGQIARELLVRLSPYDGTRQSLWLSVIAGTAMAVAGAALLHSVFTAVFFGYLAYASYSTLQQLGGRAGFGGSGPW